MKICNLKDIKDCPGCDTPDGIILFLVACIIIGVGCMFYLMVPKWW